MLNNLKNMLGEQQFNEAMSKISPEMIENFSNSINSNSTNNNHNEQSSNNNNNINSNNDNGFDFDNLDIATILKLKSILNKMNTENNDKKEDYPYNE